MDKYYYFVAQLPFLIFNKKGYPDREYFLAEAKKWLSDKDFLLLSRVSLNDFYPGDKDNNIVTVYKDFELSLREKVACFRRDKANREFMLSGEFSLNLGEGTPLEIEKRLLRLRWQFIESLETGHAFDLEALILYFLKLQILERLFIFNKEEGTAIFDKLCEVRL